MIIISKYKDCYDYLSTIYGVDKKVIYNRKEFKISNEQFKKITPILDKLIGVYSYRVEYAIPTSNSSLFEREFYYRWICVNGRMFLCLAKVINMNSPEYLVSGQLHTPFRVITQEDFDYINQYKPRYRLDKKKFKYEKYIGNKVNSNIVEISKIINQPIFNLSELAKYIFNTNLTREEYFAIIPNLGKLNIPSAYPVEQIYQDLNYFLVNVLKDNPDTTPPVIISDKDKIEGHGFDSKISFRKRK